MSQSAPRTQNPFFAHWVILFLALAALGSALAFLGYREYLEVERHQGARLQNQAKVVAANLDSQLESVHRVLLSVREEMTSWSQNGDWSPASRRLKALSDAMPGVRALLILDAQGGVLAADRQELLGRNFRQREYFQAARRRPDPETVYVSPPFKSALGVFIMNMTMMIPGPGGEFAGVIAASLDPEFFTILLESVRYAPDMWVAIAHGDGLQFLMNPEREGMAGLNLAVPGSFYSRHMASGRQESLLAGVVHATGERRLMALRTIKPTSLPLDKPLVLAVGREWATMHAGWQRDAWTQGGLFACIALLAVASLHIYHRRQRQHLRQVEAAQTALRESELWMRSTFHSLDVALFVTTPDRRLVTCNETALEMFGYTLEELRDKSAEIAHVDAEHFQEFNRRIHLCFDRGEVARFEFQLKRSNGQVFPSEHTVSLLKNDQGQPLGILSIVRDITQAKRAEEELARWAHIFQHAEWGVVVGSDDTQALEIMNPAFARMHGYTVEELKGRPILDVFAPQSRAEVAESIRLAHEKGHHVWEAWHQRKDGGVFPALIDVTAVKDQSGRVLYRVVNVQDITERRQWEEQVKQLNQNLERRVAERTEALDATIGDLEREIAERKLAERELSKSQAFNNGIIDNSPDCIKVLDSQGRLKYMSPGGLAMMELTHLGGYLDQPYEEFWAQADQEAVGKALSQAKAGQRGGFQGYCPTASGVPKWWDVRVTPILDADKRVDALLVVSRDITERKRSEQDMARAKEQAEAASLAKSQFLAAMSHEIRTPLNGIIGMTDVVLETSLDDQQREYLGIVKSSSAHLLGLLNDVLDISKIEAGKVELELAPFRLRASLGQTIATQAQRARDKGLELLYQVLPEVPDALVGDFGRIRQVLLNLISNAVKFTEAGEVRVQVGLAGLAGLNQRLDQDAELLLVVTDTGVGVPPEKVRDIFEPFSQADASTSRKYGGTGLGLTICRQLVQMMGGEMWMDSRPGAGSTFSFTLRLGLDTAEAAGQTAAPAEEARPAAPPAGEPGAGYRILLVEDNLVNQKLALILLRKRGHQVTVAGNGLQALQALAREKFDLVFMDVEMPEMDGLTATRAIRGQERPGDGRLPIIAMTAHAMAEDRRRCFQAGMDDYLTKPLEPQKLYELVESWGRGRRA